MGATVAVSRRVGAFNSRGEIIYALFESTYESNVHPHTAHESIVAFGNFAEVLRWVVIACGVTCGGMLRSRGGDFTPHGYFGLWMKAFDDARELLDQPLHIRARLNQAFEPGREIERTAVVCRGLRACGMSEQTDAYERGEDVDLRLYRDTDLLRAILSTGSGGEAKLPAWRSGIDPLLGDFDARLNPTARSGASPIPGMAACWVDGENYVAFVDGLGQFYGWRYAIMESLVNAIVYDAHLINGDGYRVLNALGTALDRALEQARERSAESGDLEIEVSAQCDELPAWKRSRYDSVAERLGRRFTLREARSAGLVLDACSIRPAARFIRPRSTLFA